MPKVIKIFFALPVIWLILIIFSVFLYILALMPAALSGRYYHFLSRRWCRIFIHALDVDLNLIYKNTRPLPKQYILIANHPSALEDFAIPALFDIYPLAKSGVRQWYIIGRIAEHAGTIFVRRSSAGSRRAALIALTEAVRSGKNIVIFPEGGCKGPRIHKTFQTGAFEISLDTGIPILPVFLQYRDQESFVWAGQTLLKKLWQIFRANDRQANYYVHDAISPEDFSDKQRYAEHVHARYMAWQKLYLDKL